MNNCFVDFLQNRGLYDSIQINESNISELCDLLSGKTKISEYCVECKEMRVFTMEPITIELEMFDGKKETRKLADVLTGHQYDQQLRKTEDGDIFNWYWSNWQTESATRIMTLPFICAMDSSHHLDYIVRTEGVTMTKIGQYPSVADLSFPELNEFKKDIDKTSIKEFRRAIGLHAQGIGVGSYVYLRRIFERVLETTRQQAQVDSSIDLSDYDSMRVSERIKTLKDYLPSIISSNPQLYGIISKGIHELSEEDCIKYFPVLKEAIFMIIGQRAQKRKEQEAIARLNATISTIVTELS